MVVLLLIGIITSFAVLSIKSDPWEVEIQRQLHRLTALVSAGSEHAILRSQELAIVFDVDRYSFMTFEEGDWEPVLDDQLLRERVMPKGIRLRLEIEDQELELELGEIVNDAKEDDDKAEDANRPMVLLLSSGEITPFSITMVVDETGARHRRSWDLFGEVQPDSDEHR